MSFKNAFIVLLILTFFGGCVTSQTNLQEPVRRYFPKTIKEFSAVDEGDYIRFYFMLNDINGRNTPSGGKVTIKVQDDLGNVLYSNFFSVSASQFLKYQYTVTGQYIGDAYEWRVPKTSFKRGICYSDATAFLTFNPDEAGLLNSETSVNVPTYSQEEIDKLMERDFMESSTKCHQSSQNNEFLVTFDRFGHYKTYSWGTLKEYLRIDLIAKNIAGSSEYFSPSGIAIIDTQQGKQFDNSYGGTLDTFSKVYPGVVLKGSILFEEFPENLSTAILVFELGHDIDYNPYTFTFDFLCE